MRYLALLPLLFLLIACGPSQEEKQNIAIITCNVMGESRNMDASMRIKEMNYAREKINADPYLYGDDKIKESFKYDLCVNLVLDDPEYEKILSSLKKEERIAFNKRENERLEQERKIREEKIIRERKEKEAEDLKKQQEEEARRIPKKEWRAAILKNLEPQEISYIYAYVSDIGTNVRIDIGASCQPGLLTKLYVKFKTTIPDLVFHNATGSCLDNSVFFYQSYSTYLSYRDYEEVNDQIDLLPTNRKDKKHEIKNLKDLIVLDANVEIYGVWDPENKEIDPRKFPPLKKREILEEPISIKAEFSDNYTDWR